MKTTFATVSLFLTSAFWGSAASVTAFAPTSWTASGTALGIDGFDIEDFEDTTLIGGLQIQLSGGTADFGPTGVVPRVFDPSADDPNGAQLFVPGLWDGTHVMMNRQSAPLPGGYVDGEWADISFIMQGGAQSFGFSLAQMDIGNTPLIVTTTAGSTTFTFSNIPNFASGSGRNGYIRIDAAPGEAILSATIDNQGGDGYSIDHVAFQPIPEPGTALLTLAGIAVLMVRRASGKPRVS